TRLWSDLQVDLLRRQRFQRNLSQLDKIWILAQSGYCIRWLWHVHGKGPYAL
ncbi:hypothetical protein BDP81DRAFT_425632, partial [Colletotrichum phormii]